MLAHLDRNGFCLIGVAQAELYKFMLAIADHTLSPLDRSVTQERMRGQQRIDAQVDAIADWAEEARSSDA